MITSFLLNVFLAVTYCALVGRTDFFDFLVGFAIGFGILALVDRKRKEGRYVGRLTRLIGFAAYFLAILVKANVAVAIEVITPGFGFQPRVVRFPVDGLTDIQVAVLANAITLTPGTLSADIDEDRQMLYVHCMYAADRDAAVAELEQLKRKLMREVFDVAA